MAAARSAALTTVLVVLAILLGLTLIWAMR